MILNIPKFRNIPKLRLRNILSAKHVYSPPIITTMYFRQFVMDLSVASHVVPFDSHFSATMPNNDDMEADLSMFSFYTGKLGLSQ